MEKMTINWKLQYTKFNIYAILVLILFSIGCNQRPDDGYTKVEMPALIQKLKNNEIDVFKLTYKDSIGGDLTDELRSKLNQGKMFRNYYANANNEITQVRLKSFSEEHVFDEIIIRELLTKPFQNFKLISIDCNSRDSLLKIAFEKDQGVRQGDHGDMQKVDSINQQIVISILENCEWPDDPELIKSIWFVIQHANSAFMAHYYSHFKNLVNQGLLKASTMALMEDRMLMNNGYPQIYGSQIVQQNVYQMRDPININKRRAEVGLGPIEEYTQRFEFEFNMDDYIEN